MTVGIIGLGGTGSITAQQLAHLGVRRFVLIDPDVVDVTNLNRLVGATHADLGHRKVEIAARQIRIVNSAAEVIALTADIVDEKLFPISSGRTFCFCAPTPMPAALSSGNSLISF